MAPGLLSRSCMTLPFFNTRAQKRDEIIAIDLGGRHTKAVHLQNKGDRFNLAGYTIQDSPSDKSTYSVDVLSDHLKAVSRALGDKTKSVVISLGVADALVRRAEMPPMSMDDMRQLLKFNSKNYLQQDLPDHVFDCSILLSRTNGESAEPAKPAPGQKQKVMVGASKRQLIEDVTTAARSAGLNAVQIVPGLVGPVNAFESSEPETFATEAVALVDVGDCRPDAGHRSAVEQHLRPEQTRGGHQGGAHFGDRRGHRDAPHDEVALRRFVVGDARLHIRPAGDVGDQERAADHRIEHERVGSGVDERGR